MTETEATDAVQRDYSIYMNTPLNLTFEGKTYAISPNELGIRLDAQASVDPPCTMAAMARSGAVPAHGPGDCSTGSDVPAVLTADNSRVDQGLLALTDVVARPPQTPGSTSRLTRPRSSRRFRSWLQLRDDPGPGYEPGSDAELGADRDRYDRRAAGCHRTDPLRRPFPPHRPPYPAPCVLKGMNGQNWSIDAQQLKSIVSVSSRRHRRHGRPECSPAPG